MVNKKAILDTFSQKVPKIEYEETDKWNHCIGISKYLLFIIPLFFIIGMGFIPRWHHQQRPVEGSSSARLMGALYSTSGNIKFDVQDYTMNQNVPDTFFVATKLDVTRQERSSNCSHDSRITWCDIGSTTKHSLTGIEDLTVMIKNWIVFQGGFGGSRTIRWNNINAYMGDRDGWKCRFDPSDNENRYCPIFKIGTLLKMAGQASIPMDKGGVISIELNWVCSATEPGMKTCKPTIKVKRIDNTELTNDISGVVFRYAIYTGKNERDYVRATGIRFMITTSGYGYSFDIVLCIIKVGGMISYISVIGLLAAVAAAHCKPKCFGTRATSDQSDDSQKGDVALEKMFVPNGQPDPNAVEKEYQSSVDMV